MAFPSSRKELRERAGRVRCWCFGAPPVLPDQSRHCQPLPGGSDPAGWDGSFPLAGLMALLSPAELAGGRAGCARGGSPVPREEERSWAQLLGSRPRPGLWSSSGSICSEDSAASFGEGMAEPLLCPQEPAGGVPRAGAHPGQDEPSLPSGRSPAVAVEPGRAPWQDRAPSRSSLESLGARISRLSRSHRGVARGVPWPGPPAQPAPDHRGSPREELLATASARRAAGIAAGSSRAATRTGAPGSALPAASSARARGHPALEPPALWGRGGSVTFTMADVDRRGAPSSRSESGPAVRRWEVLEERAGL